MTTCCTPSQPARTAEAPAVKPRFSVASDKENYAVQVELPGVAKEGVNINLENNVLAIHAKRKASVQDGWKVLHRELSDLDFLLRLKLTVPVDEDKMTAKLEHGVLTVTLPVKEAAKPRRIEVS